MKKLLITSVFFLLGIAAFAQSSTDQNKPRLAEADKKDSVVSEPNNAQLETASPVSASQKDQIKSSGTTNGVDKSPVLSESSAPKREEE